MKAIPSYHYLGTGTLITDLEGRPHQFFLNLPYGETFIEQKHAGYDNPYKFNGKELDEETGLYYYGARYYDPKISLWLSVDRYTHKYPGMSPYNYTAGNPINFVDVKGDSIYVVFDGKSHKLYIYNDNNTRADFSDDELINSFDAHNNVVRNSNGKWEDGIYEMLDKNFPHKHGNATDARGIKLDSKNGAYGPFGIFRAKPFRETTTNKIRTGMGIHSGRAHKPFMERRTKGCIRTTDKAMKTLINSIKKYGAFHTLIVRNNRLSENTNKVLDLGKVLDPNNKTE